MNIERLLLEKLHALPVAACAGSSRRRGTDVIATVFCVVSRGATIIPGAFLRTVDPHFNTVGAGVVNDIDFVVNAPAAGGEGRVVVMPQIAAAAQLELERGRAAGGITKDLKRRVAKFAVFSIETALELMAAG